MKRQYVPVPYDALDLVSRPEDRALVLALYELGHSRRWRPTPRSVRDLAERHGLPRSRVSRILHRLADEGLLRLHRQATGSRAEALRIEVLDPSEGVGHERGHEPGHERDTSRDTESESDSASQGDGGTRAGTRVGHEPGHEPGHLPSSDPDPDPDPDPLTPKRDRSSGSGEVVSLPGVEGDPWKAIHTAWGNARVCAGYGRPTVKLSPSRGMGRKLAPHLKRHGLQAVLDVLRWWGEGESGPAPFNREHDHGLATVARHFEAYLEHARSEQQGGMQAIKRDLAKGIHRTWEGSNEF